MAGYANLGQCMAHATPTTFTALLSTSPATAQLVLSTLVITNQTSSQQTVDVRFRVNGAVANDKQFLLKSADIEPKGHLFLTIGIAVAVGDVIEVAASSPNISFNVFGLSA